MSVPARQLARWWVTAMVWQYRLRLRLRRAVMRPRTAVEVLNFRTRRSGKPMTAVIARRSTAVDYLLEAIGELPAAGTVATTRTWASRLDAVLGSHPDADIVVVRSDRPWSSDPSSEGFWCVPENVGTIVDFESGMHDGSFRAGKSIRKRMRRHGYRASLASNGRDFARFYERAYRPYVRRRFGRLARPHSRRDLLHAFHRGGLLFVLDGDQRVAASLFSLRDGTVRIHASAPLEDAADAVANGALAAARKFVLDRAIAAGCRRADLGSCRPSAFDGVLLHKLQWGARVCDSGPDGDNLYIRWPAFCADIADWLQRMPLIVRDGTGLSALTAVGPDLPPEEIPAHLARMAIPGLKRIIVLSGHSGAHELEKSGDHDVCWVRPDERPVAAA